jgi:hypothetical protein
MKTVNVPITTLETLIEGLQSAVNVCYNVDSTEDNCERTYPYATGYSRGAMEMIISNLEYLKSQAN